MKKIKSLSFYSAIMIPYLLSCLLYFFTFMSKESNTSNEIDSLKTMLGMDTSQFNIILILFMTIANIVIFFIVFYILKLFIFLFDKAKVAKNKDLFLSLLIGYTITNLCALIINDFFNVPIDIADKIMTFMDVIIFTGLYYYFSKLKKITIILCIIKLIISLPEVLL
ncbi:hypothetical protein [Staphylococcus kloosii]|uniref:Uncharacterized protein n=1 Tax=Staphylococcus kloosii TaxID=29384 RepID=A0A151A3L7_9STAP|nr:hypothetical protein [Staphylococcus kloosii]KYH14004.1 hypothetical protein A0131_04205 [Staphylococcus kloosii]